MQVILREDVEKLGAAGQVATVADGYARNYLIPRGLAFRATPGLVRWSEKGQDRRRKLRDAALQQARDLAGKLSGVALSFTRPVGAQGKLFGSVGKSDIVASLKASGFTVDKKHVVLAAAIKEVGDFDVEIRLGPESAAKIKVSVLARS